MQSGGRVQVRAVVPSGGKVIPFAWETDRSWFDPTQHDATFVISSNSTTPGTITPASAERDFGQQAAVYQVAGLILVYQKNLLRELPRQILAYVADLPPITQ